MDAVWTPDNEESDRLLDNVTKWIDALKKKKVEPSIAAYVARDFLQPMRLSTSSSRSATEILPGPPSEVTIAEGKFMEAEEVKDTEEERHGSHKK